MTTPSSKNPGPLQMESYRYALASTFFCKNLFEKKREFVLSKQFLKSSTSVGANIEEAQFAQSRADFISKFSIALKEANESRYWLRLLKDAGFASVEEVSELNVLVQRIIGMLVLSIKTAKGGLC